MVVQENHYYPFGLGIKGLDYTAPSPNKENKFTFNGKEKQTELGLNQYDYGARGFDYQLNRTTTLDPHADSYHSVSAYSFLNNNPLRFIDPTGMDVEDGFNEDGTLHRGTAYDQMKAKDDREREKRRQQYADGNTYVNLETGDALIKGKSKQPNGNLYVFRNSNKGATNAFKKKDFGALASHSTALITNNKMVGSFLLLQDYLLGQLRFLEKSGLIENTTSHLNSTRPVAYLGENKDNFVGLALNAFTVIGNRQIGKTSGNWQLNVRGDDPNIFGLLGNIYNTRNILSHEAWHGQQALAATSWIPYNDFTDAMMEIDAILYGNYNSTVLDVSPSYLNNWVFRYMNQQFQRIDNYLNNLGDDD
jgi:RHS repeat-associated protein